MRRTRRSQCTLREKAFSREACFSSSVNISRAVSRMRRNCWSRSGEIADMVGIIRSLVVGRSQFVVRRLLHRSSLVGDDFCEGLAEPVFDRYSHLLESSFEEMISGFDAD